MPSEGALSSPLWPAAQLTFRLASPADPRLPTARSGANRASDPLAPCLPEPRFSVSQSESSGSRRLSKDKPQESRAGSEARAGPGSRQPRAPYVPPPPTADPRLEGAPHLGAGAFPAQYSSEGPGVGTGACSGLSRWASVLTDRPHSLWGRGGARVCPQPSEG